MRSNDEDSVTQLWNVCRPVMAAAWRRGVIRRWGVLLLALVAGTLGGCGTTRSSAAAREAALRMDALRACEGVASDDAYRGLEGLPISGAHLLVRFTRYGTILEGAEIVVSRGGSSVAELSRNMACRTARSRAADDVNDPLSVPSAVVRVVHETGGVALVQIRARRAGAVREIVRRVRAALPERTVEAPAGTNEGEMTSDGAARPGRSRAPAARPPTIGPSRPGSLLDTGRAGTHARDFSIHHETMQVEPTRRTSQVHP